MQQPALADARFAFDGDELALAFQAALVAKTQRFEFARASDIGLEAALARGLEARPDA